MADVLAFYQERIANEAFLRTATERRSVLELAALLGYELAPGVAADTWLAFTLQDAPGAPAKAPLPVTIPAGTRAQSVPGPDETPQTFETVAADRGPRRAQRDRRADAHAAGDRVRADGALPGGHATTAWRPATRSSSSAPSASATRQARTGTSGC